MKIFWKLNWTILCICRELIPPWFIFLTKPRSWKQHQIGVVACHRSQLTIFWYEKPFAQVANWNLNRNLLGANCQSKYQHCVTILQSGAQMNNRFHCNNYSEWQNGRTARMGSDSIAHEAEGWMGYWLRGHEGGINNIFYCFSKIQLAGQK